MTADSDSVPRLLILGASGFIGRHLLRLVGERGFLALGTRSGRHTSPLRVFRSGQDRILDCIDRKFVEGDGPCWVVHATSFGSIDACRRHAVESRRVNVEGVIQVMEDLDASHIRHVVLSTSHVFDGEEGDYSEDSACRPLNLYGKQKREVEEWVLTNRPDSLVFRLDKIVGTDPQEDHLFSQWQRLVAEQRPIVCVEGMTFSPTLVEDVVEGIIEACCRNLDGLYHIAPAGCYSREELAREFLVLTGAHAKVRVEPLEGLGLVERRPLRTNLHGVRLREATGHECSSMTSAIRAFHDRMTSLHALRDP